MTKPELLVLDEPFNGLDPSTQLRLIKILNQLKAETNTTILISSHDLNHITEVSDRIVLLEDGNVKYDMEKTENTLMELESYFSA